MSLSLDWGTRADGAAVAAGRHYTYRIAVSADSRIKLARFPRIAAAAEDLDALVEQVMLTTIEVSGVEDPHARLYRAMALAQQFEDGRSLPGQPEWQDPPMPRPQTEGGPLAEGDGSALRILGTTGGHFGPTRYPHTPSERTAYVPEFTPEQAAEMLAKFKDRWPDLRLGPAPSPRPEGES